MQTKRATSALLLIKRMVSNAVGSLELNFIENINGMIPITIGTDKNPMGGIGSLVQVYANPITEKFAIVEHFAISKSCIIFQGDDFDIILPERYLRGPTG